MAYKLRNDDVIFNSARLFARTQFAKHPDWARTLEIPANKCIVLTCLDCRIFPQQLFGLQMGETHVIRNAGGSAEAALRDIVISQQSLGTEEIFVVKHDGCGMLGGTNAELLAGLKAKTEDKAEDFSPAAFATIQSLTLSGIEDTGVERALEDDVKFLQTHPAIKKHTRIHGLIYNIYNGRTRQPFRNGARLDSRTEAALPSDEEAFLLDVTSDSEFDGAVYERQLLRRLGEDISNHGDESKGHHQAPLGSAGLRTGAISAATSSSPPSTKKKVSPKGLKNAGKATTTKKVAKKGAKGSKKAVKK